MEYIYAIEKELKITAKKEYLPNAARRRSCNICRYRENWRQWIKFKPKTKIQDGVKSFIEWYRKFYKDINEITTRKLFM